MFSINLTGAGSARAVVVTGAAALLLAGCGSQEPAEPAATGSPAEGTGSPTEGATEATASGPVLENPLDVRFSLEFSPTGYHAPYALALEEGWFEDAGLNVQMTPGTGSSATINAVAGGQADIGIADLATLVIAKTPELPVKAFGVMFGEAPTAVAVHEDSGVQEPADLEGTSIAITTGGLDAQLLPAFLESNELTGKVEAVNVSSSAKTGAFLARRVDGFVPLLCGTGIVVEQQEGAPLTTFPLAEYGVDVMGLGFITNESFLEENPEALEVFLSVVDRAWQYAEENPEEAVAAMLERFPELQEETAQGQLECAFDFLHSDATEGEPVGAMAAENWEAMIATLEQYAGVNPLEPGDYYATDFIDQ